MIGRGKSIHKADDDEGDGSEFMRTEWPWFFLESKHKTRL